MFIEIAILGFPVPGLVLVPIFSLIGLHFNFEGWREGVVVASGHLTSRFCENHDWILLTKISNGTYFQLDLYHFSNLRRGERMWAGHLDIPPFLTN